MEIEDGPMPQEMPELPQFSAQEMEKMMATFMKLIMFAFFGVIGVGFIRFVLHHPTPAQWIGLSLVVLFCVVSYFYERKQITTEDVLLPEMACAA